MSTTNDAEPRGRSHALVPAGVAAGTTMVLLLGGTLLSEFLFEHHDLAQKDDPSSVFVLQAMHPFGLTGLIAESPSDAPAALVNDSAWLVLLGVAVTTVGVFAVTLFALRSLTPGRSTFAAGIIAWFAAMAASAVGGLVVGLVNARDDAFAESLGAVVARVWMLNGLMWGFSLGAVVGLLVVAVWRGAGNGNSPAAAARARAESGPKVDPFGVDADWGTDDSPYPPSR